MIEIKTPVEKPPRFYTPTRHIELKNGWFSRLLGAPKYERSECAYAGPSWPEPVIIDIIDEVNVVDWHTLALDPTKGMRDLKRDVKIQDEKNNVYILYGAFPITITMDGKRATLEYDKCVKETK